MIGLENPSLVVLPRPDNGPVGPPGPVGPVGPAGPVGPVGPAGAGAVFWWGNDSVSSAINTRYLTPGYEGGTAPLVSSTRQALRAPRAGTLRNLYVEHNGLGGGGNLIVYTVYVNGAATLLAVSIAANAATASNLVDTVAVAAGALVEIIVSKAANLGGSPSNIVTSVELG